MEPLHALPQIPQGLRIVDRSEPLPRGGEPVEEWEIRPLDAVIESYLAAAVKATGGNVRKAARLLEISPSTIYAKLKSRD